MIGERDDSVIISLLYLCITMSENLPSSNAPDPSKITQFQEENPEFFQLLVAHILDSLPSDRSLSLAEAQKILETFGWIRVARYRDDEALSWEERYKRLEQHHIEETSFLIERIRTLVRSNLS